jgi:hypothetical protein
MVKLVDTEQSLTENEFCEFAKLFHGKIPEAFKSHYMRYNGGSTTEESDYDDFYFIPIKYGGYNIESLALDSELNRHWMNNWDRECVSSWDDCPKGEPIMKEGFVFWKPLTFIPFGNDSSGACTTFYISLRDCDCGCVYIYLDESGGLCQLGNSFEEFLSKWLWPDDKP